MPNLVGSSRTSGGQADRYSTGKFIRDNYRQALNIIQEDSEALAVLCKELKIGEDVFEQYLSEERQYYKSRVVEPPAISAQLDYVESLVRLEETW